MLLRFPKHQSTHIINAVYYVFQRDRVNSGYIFKHNIQAGMQPKQITAVISEWFELTMNTPLYSLS